MSEEPMERDLELAEALCSALGEVPDEHVDWAGLRESVARRAAPALAKQRAARLRRRIFVPGAAVAACAALLTFALRGTPGAPVVEAPPAATPAATSPVAASPVGAATATLERMLDLEASDEEVRALLSGAGDMNELLLLAAAGETE